MTHRRGKTLDFGRDKEGGVRMRRPTGPQCVATIPQLHGRRELWIIQGREFWWKRPGAPPTSMKPFCSQDDDGIWFVDPNKA